MSKILYILFLILIIDNFNFVYTENKYKINIIDSDLKTAYFSSILLDKNGFYYIVTGENYDPYYNQDSKSFRRCILKFDSKTNILVHKYNFDSSFPLGISKTILYEKYMQYILTISKNSVEFFTGKKIVEYESEDINIIGKQDLIKADSFIYNAYIQEKIEDNKIEHYMMINKYEIYEGESPFYKVLASSKPIQIAPYLRTISCSTTKDNQFILCAYYSNHSIFTISIFDINLNLIEESYGELLHEKDQIDIFLKILYFKDVNKFIIINTLNDYTTRIRYIKYSKNSFVDLLYILTNSEEFYLDIKETPYDPISTNNDITALEQDKIVKISFFKSRLIFTIFQFYNHDTVLFVKTYKLINNDKNIYNSNINPSLSIVNNNILISLSTEYKEKPLTGYFFLNYPNLKELSLTKSSFLVKEIISIENNIFDLNIKLRVLEIPNNCIFIRHKISSSTYEEIKEGDILEQDEEIILRQYKIEVTDLSLRYKAIAIGKDSGYSSYMIFPSDVDQPSYSDIYLEGKEGNLVINFERCFEGYYKIEDKMRVCTNKNPKGYYFDERDNIYRKCSKPCFDCSGPYISDHQMNCISCINNYILTEDTNSCFNYVPLNYIKEDNILKRCHPLCSECSQVSKNDSDMHCLQCQYGYFLRTDTYNCINPDEFKKKEKISLTQKSNIYMILFIIIFIISIMFSFFISMSCLNDCIIRKIYSIHTDEEEITSINNKDEKSLISVNEKSIELPELKNAIN